MREGEMLALTAAHIDLDNRIISVNKTYARTHGQDVITTPKTNKSKRRILITDFLCDELKEFMDNRYMLMPEDRLFPYTKSFLIHEMIRGCDLSGVKKIRIHDIRHSHASLLINQGCDALVIADRLGHEKVSTTLNTYSHLFSHKQTSLVSSLENLVASAKPKTEPPAPTPKSSVINTAPSEKEKAPGKVIPMPIRNVI